MNWSKVDAGLASALTDEGGPRRYAVFVHLAADADADADVLADLGLEASGEGRIRTASVSAAEVDLLSDQEWVTRLTISTTLRLAGEG